MPLLNIKGVCTIINFIDGKYAFLSIVVCFCIICSACNYAEATDYYKKNKVRLEKEYKIALQHAVGNEVPLGYGPSVKYVNYNEQQGDSFYGPSGYVLSGDINDDSLTENVLIYKIGNNPDNAGRYKIRVVAVFLNEERKVLLENYSDKVPLLTISKLFKNGYAKVFLMTCGEGKMGGSSTQDYLMFTGLDDIKPVYIESAGYFYGWEKLLKQMDKNAPCVNLLCYYKAIEIASIKTVFFTCGNEKVSVKAEDAIELLKSVEAGRQGRIDSRNYECVKYCANKDMYEVIFSKNKKIQVLSPDQAQ